MLDVLVCSLFAERFLQLCEKYSPHDKPIPFIKKSSNDRDLQILGYFVSGKDAIRAMSGELLTENTVEQNPSSIPRACTSG